MDEIVLATLVSCSAIWFLRPLQTKDKATSTIAKALLQFFYPFAGVSLLYCLIAITVRMAGNDSATIAALYQWEAAIRGFRSTVTVLKISPTVSLVLLVVFLVLRLAWAVAGVDERLRSQLESQGKRAFSLFKTATKTVTVAYLVATLLLSFSFLASTADAAGTHLELRIHDAEEQRQQAAHAVIESLTRAVESEVARQIVETNQQEVEHQAREYQEYAAVWTRLRDASNNATLFYDIQPPASLKEAEERSRRITDILPSETAKAAADRIFKPVDATERSLSQQQATHAMSTALSNSERLRSVMRVSGREITDKAMSMLVKESVRPTPLTALFEEYPFAELFFGAFSKGITSIAATYTNEQVLQPVIDKLVRAAANNETTFPETVRAEARAIVAKAISPATIWQDVRESRAADLTAKVTSRKQRLAADAALLEETQARKITALEEQDARLQKEITATTQPPSARNRTISNSSDLIWRIADAVSEEPVTAGKSETLEVLARLSKVPKEFEEFLLFDLNGLLDELINSSYLKSGATKRSPGRARALERVRADYDYSVKKGVLPAGFHLGHPEPTPPPTLEESRKALSTRLKEIEARLKTARVQRSRKR